MMAAKTTQRRSYGSGRVYVRTDSNGRETSHLGEKALDAIKVEDVRRLRAQRGGGRDGRSCVRGPVERPRFHSRFQFERISGDLRAPKRSKHGG
jgi:hypothetical protein